MIDLLLEAFPRHYHLSKIFTIEQLDRVSIGQSIFEICDQNAGLCNDGEGTLVVPNPELVTIDSIPARGKREKAISQLSETILKLMEVPEIAAVLGAFPLKLGVFAFRLTDDTDSNHPVVEMTRAFNRFSREVPALKTDGALPHNFIYHQRRYPEPLVFG